MENFSSPSKIKYIYPVPRCKGGVWLRTHYTTLHTHTQIFETDAFSGRLK